MNELTSQEKGRIKLLDKWVKYTTSEQTQENIDKGNETFLELENILPFKDKYEKERWQDYASWFTNFEDFYDFTKAIITLKEYFIQKERNEYNCDEYGRVNNKKIYTHCCNCGKVVLLKTTTHLLSGQYCKECYNALPPQHKRVLDW